MTLIKSRACLLRPLSCSRVCFSLVRRSWSFPRSQTKRPRLSFPKVSPQRTCLLGRDTCASLSPEPTMRKRPSVAHCPFTCESLESSNLQLELIKKKSTYLLHVTFHWSCDASDNDPGLLTESLSSALITFLQ